MDKKTISRFWNKVDVCSPEDCWNWIASTNGGNYGKMNIDGNIIYAHRVSWEINFGSIPNGLCVLHTCDNKLYVNPNHLYLGTNDDNISDKISKNRQAKGVSAGGAKLTDKDILDIRYAYKFCNVTQQMLSETYKTSRTNISFIVNNKRWKGVQNDKLQ